jgi:hypothetical protein
VEDGKNMEHSIEDLIIQCGKFYSRVKDGVCKECGRRVKVVTEPVENLLEGELL